MQDWWKVLEDAGVPSGPIRPPPRSLDHASVHAAIVALANSADALPLAQREPLLAWLRAWRHHWPASFAARLGPEGARLVERFTDAGFDADRYLKLRRIAIENLSHVL